MSCSMTTPHNVVTVIGATFMAPIVACAVVGDLDYCHEWAP